MAAKMTKCLCSTFEFGNTETDENTQEPFFEGYGTGCRQSTTKTFAQGHDAKLVGYLVRAELAGEEIRVGSTTWGSAVAAALWISPALGLKATAMMDAAKARLVKKVAQDAAKTARKSAKAAAEPLVESVAKAPKPTTRQARIKVGRWEYDATIDMATGQATHTRKLGGTRTVGLGEYKEV